MPDNLKERQHLYNGFGETLSRAFELVVTPVIFALVGFGLDHLFNTVPVFTVILALFALVGTAIRTYYVYDADMKKQEAQLPKLRRGLS